MELIRKSDALHAVLHNTGDAAVAAVQAIKPINPHGELREMLIDAQIDREAEYERGKRDAVVHGEWVSEWGGWLGYTLTVKCSICGAEALYRYDGDDTDVDRVYSRYCPNCGAKMKGANDEQIH